MYYDKSPETIEYEQTVNQMAQRKAGPTHCRCGSTEVTWGGSHKESIIHCQKCECYVKGKTIDEAIQLWKAKVDAGS